MRLGKPPEAYNQLEQARLRAALEQADAQNLKKGADILMGGSERIVLYSPNGTAYALQVNNAGTLSTAAYP